LTLEFSSKKSKSKSTCFVATCAWKQSFSSRTFIWVQNDKNLRRKNHLIFHLNYFLKKNYLSLNRESYLKKSALQINTEPARDVESLGVRLDCFREVRCFSQILDAPPQKDIENRNSIFRILGENISPIRKYFMVDYWRNTFQRQFGGL